MLAVTHTHKCRAVTCLINNRINGGAWIIIIIIIIIVVVTSYDHRQTTISERATIGRNWNNCIKHADVTEAHCETDDRRPAANTHKPNVIRNIIILHYYYTRHNHAESWMIGRSNDQLFCKIKNVIELLLIFGKSKNRQYFFFFLALWFCKNFGHHCHRSPITTILEAIFSIRHFECF